MHKALKPRLSLDQIHTLTCKSAFEAFEVGVDGREVDAFHLRAVRADAEVREEVGEFLRRRGLRSSRGGFFEFDLDEVSERQDLQVFSR